MEELYFLSASELLTRIKDKSISVQEIMSNLFSRIEEINPKINALVTYDKSAVLSQAKKIDKKIARNGHSKVGMLGGLPVTIKDNIEVEGMITTGGIKSREKYKPSFDATVVQRLKAAGAIVLGKTNCPAFCAGFETENNIYGRTNNPYNLDRTVGSSSGGEAALTAAGGSYLGLGSDTGGSIRWPSSFCGIASLTPTFGRIPRTGTIPPYMGYIDSTQIGPMARSVKDLILTFPIIMGPDNWDSKCLPLQYEQPENINLENLKIAYYADNDFVKVDKKVKKTISNAVDELSEKNLDLVEGFPKASKEFTKISLGLNSFSAKLNKETVPDISEWSNPIELYPEKILDLSEEWLKRAQKAEGIEAMLGVEFFFWGFKWDAYRTRILQFMKNHDAIICPVSAKPAFSHGESSKESFNGLDLLSYTHPYSLVGLPSVTIRGGTSSDQLPIGIQIITGHGKEGLALKLALYLEEKLGGWQKPPI